MKIIVQGCLIAQMKRFDALITTQKKPRSLQSPIPEKSRKTAKNDHFSVIRLSLRAAPMALEISEAT